MTLQSRGLPIFLAASAILLLAGCGGEDLSSPSSASTVDVGVLAGEAQVESSGARAAFADLQAEFVESESKFAECVLLLGFEYRPRVPTVEIPQTEYLPTRADRVRQYGYGIVDSIDGTNGISVTIDGGTVPPSQETAFRNQVVFNAEAPCLEHYWQADLQQLLVERLQLQAEPPPDILSNPNYIAAEAAWSRCMANAGYPFGNRSEPSLAVFSQHQRIVSENPAEDLTDSDELAALREFELAVALVDLGCYAEHIDPLIERLLQAG